MTQKPGAIPAGAPGALMDAPELAERDLLRQLFDAMPQLGWTALPDGFLDYYNRGWYEYTGTTYEEMKGWGWTAVQHPDELPRVMASWEASIATGKAWEIQFPLRRRDGVYRWFLSRATPIFDNAGKLVRWVGINTDIDDQKRAERQLAELDNAKTTFFSNVSHELRTPLTLILGPIEDALRSSSSSLSGSALEGAHRNALRLLKLVNTLLDFSRIEAGRAEACFVETDIGTFTRELASAFESAMKLAGLQFEIDCPRIDAPVYVDHDLWEKVVLNLLSNALKFTFEGKVTVTLRRDGAHVVLDVSDTGTGIAADDLPHVFERFQRVSGARSRTHEGSGIGLALVQEIVGMHRGTVSVESTPGRGSSFRVRIPIGRDHLPAERIGAAASLASTSLGATPYVQEALRWLPGAGSELETVSAPKDIPEGIWGARILVADDNADMREYLGRLLGGRWVVQPVADGEAALAAVRTQKPDLVLTDVMMPNVDGFALLRQLRADSATKSVPVIMVSARAGEEARLEGLAAGADDYLVKPFSARELVARVAAQLQIAQLVERERVAREDAESANQMKDEFLAMLGHELRNPLSPILTALHLAKLRGSDGIARELGVIERQAHHLVRLVDDLLDVARIAQGKVALNRDSVEIAEIIATAIEVASPLIENGMHRLITDVPKHGLVVNADRTRMAQVIGNLLTNAAKYTPSGGQITVTAMRDGDEVVVRIDDTGAGITADLLPKVFDLFVQSRQTLDRSRGGLGLGLTIVKNLTALHGGTVTAESTGLGKGSTFTVRLPAADRRPSTPTAAPRPPYAGASRGHRVLVVDDNQDSAEMLAETLRSLGYSAATANDGSQALLVAEQFQPDTALLDIGLPVMDGYELAQRLRQQAPNRDLFLVAITGYGRDTDQERSRAAGFHKHFTKPVDLDAVATLLEERGK